VALDERHLEELVNGHAPPPPARANDSAASLVICPAWPPGIASGKWYWDGCKRPLQGCTIVISLQAVRACLGGRLGVSKHAWGWGWGLLQARAAAAQPPASGPFEAGGADGARAQVRMGFPQRNAEGVEGVAFLGAECRLGAGGFTCPRCRARVVELPSRCGGAAARGRPCGARPAQGMLPRPAGGRSWSCAAARHSPERLQSWDCCLQAERPKAVCTRGMRMYKPSQLGARFSTRGPVGPDSASLCRSPTLPDLFQSQISHAHGAAHTLLHLAAARLPRERPGAGVAAAPGAPGPPGHLTPGCLRSCHVCGLTLVSSPHLARSYHHLFPVQPFVEVGPGELARIQVAPAHTWDINNHCVPY